MTIYISKLIEHLEQLSDKCYQRRAWLATSGPEVSSFIEDICQAFDDTGLTDSIEDGTLADRVGEDCAAALIKLHDATLRVDESLPPKVLIDHPSMDLVRALASDALSKLSSAT